ncbi:MAG: LuxR C-terminal-related transcriptional regulator [Suipraeoptans sp.]
MEVKQKFDDAVFYQYTKEEQEVIIIISVLDSIPRELIQAVSKARKREISELLTDNPYIKYDAKEKRLYFEKPYKDFLTEKYYMLDKDVIEKTIRAAAQWCKNKGHYYDAIKCYRVIKSNMDIWDTICIYRFSRRNITEAKFIIENIEDFPEVFKDKNPRTRILLSVLYVNNLEFTKAMKTIEKVRIDLEEIRAEEEILGECYCAIGIMYILMGRDGYGEYFKRAAELLPNGSRMWSKEILLIDLGPALILNSSSEGALLKSIEEIDYAIKYIPGLLYGTGMGMNTLCKSEAAFLSGDIKGAIEYGYQALYMGEAYSQGDVIGSALLIILRSYILQGDYENIVDTVEHVERYRRDDRFRNLGIWDIIYGWFYSEFEEGDKVVLWVRNAIHYGYAPISIERPNIIRMRCLVVGRQYMEALALIEQLEELAKIKKSIPMLLHIEICRAVSLYAVKEKEEALRSLERAYELSVGNNLTTLFIEYGNRLRALLLYVKESKTSIPNEWLYNLYTKVNTFAKKHAILMKSRKQVIKGGEKDFKLSEREKTILTNISQGLTREEIGELLYLSPNTIKSVLKQIYAKLGAINAADAVRIGIVNEVI